MWRARIPPGHPRWSSPSTRGTSGHQSSCGHPRPEVVSTLKAVVRDALTNLLGGDRLLRGLVQLLNGLLVEAQILLAADENDGKALAEMQNLGDPLQRC